jgi:hypothetical protein
MRQATDIIQRQGCYRCPQDGDVVFNLKNPLYFSDYIPYDGSLNIYVYIDADRLSKFETKARIWGREMKSTAAAHTQMMSVCPNGGAESARMESGRKGK